MFDLSRLWRIPGGLQLEAKKAESTRLPSTRPALTRHLVLSLRSYDGSLLTPVIGIQEQVLKGQMIACSNAGDALHAPSSGIGSTIEDRPLAQPLQESAPCIVIETDGAERWGECLPPLPGFRQVDAATLLARIRSAGVVGLGGAAFPTAAKLAARNIDLLLLNGAECEPYISCDDMLMRERARAVIVGGLIMRHILQAPQMVIALEDNKPEAYRALAAAVAELRADPQVLLRSIPSIYPSGGERQLIRIVSGVEVPEDGYPGDRGIICQNVATAAAVYDAVIDGRPLLSRYITVTGTALAEPRVLEALIGTPVIDLIGSCGGYTDTHRRLIMGGPMMGFTLADDRIAIGKGSHCVLVQPAAVSAPEMPCIGCGACVGVCPARLLPQTLYSLIKAQNYEQARTQHLSACIECGCCAVVCPSHIPLVDYYRRAKAEIRTQQQDRIRAEHARQRFEARRQRLQREQNEHAARLQQKKTGIRETVQNSAQDTKKAAIAAALARVRSKKAANPSLPQDS
jgi:electron transport complex protein RnfC